MGREHDPAVVVTDLEVRVMVLDVGHMCDGVHKTHRPIEVLEGELAADRPRVRRQLPAAVQFREQRSGGFACQRCDAPFTGFALFLREREVAHASTARSVSVTSSLSLRVKLRATYFSTRSWN